MIINGFVFNSAMLSGYQCVTFKFSETPSVVALDGYVHIRGDIKSAGDLFAQISSIAPAGLILGVYENTYPVKEGYFYIQDRRVTVNNYSIVSNVLKDQTTIVSIKLPNNFRLYKGTTPVNVWAYPTEDYIFIVRREAATQTEFDSEILTLNNYPIGYPEKMYNISILPGAEMFTTYSLVPNWRYDENITLSDRSFVNIEYYYYYELDFKDYFVELSNKMEEILKFKVIHKSENIHLEDRDISFITYKIEYQDKPAHALYRQLGPFETHQFVTAKINFVFHTADFYIYRGFINDFGWFAKLTNNLTLVCVTKPPSTIPYCATVKWLVDDLDYTILNEVEEVNSERNYWNYTVEFSCELYYFWVRSKPVQQIIDDVLGILTEPREDSPQCSDLNWRLSRLTYTVDKLSGTVTITEPPGTIWQPLQ